VQRSLCNYRDGGFPWTTRLHQILFEVRENCYSFTYFYGSGPFNFPKIYRSSMLSAFLFSCGFCLQASGP